MKGELKAGGLAIIIRSTQTDEIGKVVTTVQLVQPGQDFVSPDGVQCRWHTAYPAAWVCAGDLSTTDIHGRDRIGGWAVYHPDALVPIDDSDPDAVDQRKRNLVTGW